MFVVAGLASGLESRGRDDPSRSFEADFSCVVTSRPSNQSRPHAPSRRRDESVFAARLCNRSLKRIME